MQNLVPVPRTGPPWIIPPGDPTIGGFTIWVQAVMAVPSGNMPDSTTLQVVFDQALNLAYWGLQTVPTVSTSMTIYAQAVYNLGGAFLVEIAQDIPPSTFWTDLRSSLNINSPTFGIIQNAADQGTSEGSYIPDVIKGMTLLDLQLMKSPWGRTYLMFAGEWGSIWGLTI